MHPIRQSQGLRLESHELFRKVGGFDLIRRGHFSDKQDHIDEKVGHVVLDKNAALSLDSEWEWEVAELIASKSLDESQ